MPYLRTPTPAVLAVCVTSPTSLSAVPHGHVHRRGTFTYRIGGQTGDCQPAQKWKSPLDRSGGSSRSALALYCESSPLANYW